MLQENRQNLLGYTITENALADWKQKREEWSNNERPAGQAMKVFETLYGLQRAQGQGG